MLDPNNWEPVTNTGYQYEFECVNDPGLIIKIVARSEKEAWRKLKNLK
ncbi:hypothetical protein [Melghiribacillus thermohalophilus]|nr:hypothetical protein [Melghiribacillus thermohalophilus]